MDTDAGDIISALARAKEILDAQEVPRDGRWFDCPLCHDYVPLEKATEHFTEVHGQDCPWRP